MPRHTSFIRHGLRALAAIAGLLVWGVTARMAQAAPDKVLNIYNWSEYIAEDTVKAFEAETGITVRYDNFDSNDILLAKMIAGRTGYDIIVPSSDFGRMMVDGGLVQKLDRSKLPLWGNLQPSIMQRMSQLDPGNQYMVPWLGGAVSVGYNADKVKAALGTEPIPANPFELVFNPKYTTKLKKCGISILDTASDLFPSALLYVGKPAFSNNQADYQEAFAMLQKVRQDIALFSYNGYITDMASGNLCVALGYSGDFNNANNRARLGGRAVHIEAPLPPGGSQFGFESMMIPVDAPHPEYAHAWINYTLRPQVQAAITNKVMFTSPNLAARKFINPEVLANPIAFPPEDYLANKAQFYEVRKADTRRVMTRLYTKFKSGL
jgi:putrescine transport system substrate-binding protein